MRPAGTLLPVSAWFTYPGLAVGRNAALCVAWAVAVE